MYSLLKRAKRLTGSLKEVLLDGAGERDVPAISLDHCNGNVESAWDTQRRRETGCTHEVHCVGGITDYSIPSVSCSYAVHTP